MDFNKHRPLLEPHSQMLCYCVIDVDDLPTQISREHVVSEKYMKLFQKFIKNKLFGILKEVKGDAEKWKEFKKNHENGLKMMAYDDPTLGSEALKLIDYKNSLSDDEMTLEEYAKMAKDLKQEQIYYISGKNVDVLKENKTVKQLKDLNKPVLLITHALDEASFQKHREFSGLKFQDITKEGFVLHSDEDSKSKLEKYQEEYKEFCAKAKEILSGIVSDVKVKNNFADAIMIQVPDHGLSATMENLQKSQPIANANMAFFNQSMKVLCINPEHQIVQRLKKYVMEDLPIGKQFLNLLANGALLISGYQPDNITTFGTQLFNMVNLAMSDSSETTETPLIKAPEVEVSTLDDVD